MRRKAAKNQIDGERKLTHVDLEITRECNLKCIHCSAASKNRGKEMPVQFIEKTLKEAKSMGLESVGLTGGEPFLDRQKLMQIGNFCTDDLGVPIHIHSNGTKIDIQDAKWIRRTKSEISIPFYGDSATVHDSVTGKIGSFESTLRGVRNLKRVGASTCVYVVPMKRNLRSVHSIVEMTYATGVRRFRILSLSPTGRANAEFDEMDLSMEETEELNASLLDVRDRLEIEVNTGFCTSQNFEGLSILAGHEQCSAAENRIHIDTFGNVFPCTASSGTLVFSAGNLQAEENSLFSIWTTSPLLQFFRRYHENPPKKCSRCARHDTCMSGCRVMMSHKYGDVTIANPTCGGPYD